ncbi:MAG: PD-(D/E)XK nuclease family protein [Chloroflexi bacterium]|nr:PD-(D/E)XK nuclease family protein [Chloroflexota bacterium]
MQITGNIHWLVTYRLPFSWSFTRGQVIRQCRRRYYYKYYAPYGGNAPDEEGDRAHILALGRLTGAAALVGSIVHRIARDSLHARRSGRMWESATSSTAARVLLQQTLHRSENACQKGRINPKQSILQDHYFGHRLDEATLLNRLDFLMHALLEHPAYRQVLASDGELLLLDEVRRFTVADVTVFAVPDVLLRESGRYRLIDWKTSSALGSHLDQAIEQLNLYALYLVRSEAVSPELINCEIAEVTAGAGRRWRVQTADIEKVEGDATSSIAEMQRSLTDAARNQTIRANFPRRMETAPGDSVCAHCAFRVLCFGIPPESDWPLTLIT